MKMFSITLGLSIAFATFAAQAQSALPPLYESLNEYKALLASPELTEKLNSADLIQVIERDSNGSFLIKTSKNTMKVHVVYDAQKMPGPAKFHFSFHDPVPLK